MKKLLLLVFLASNSVAFAVDYFTTGNSTNWDDAAAWTCNCVPPTTDWGTSHTITVNHTLTHQTDLTLNGVSQNLVINAPLNIVGTSTLTANEMQSNEWNGSSDIYVDLVITETMYSGGVHSPVIHGDVTAKNMELNADNKAIFNGVVNVIENFKVTGGDAGAATFNGEAYIGGDVTLEGSGRIEELDLLIGVVIYSLLEVAH